MKRISSSSTYGHRNIMSMVFAISLVSINFKYFDLKNLYTQVGFHNDISTWLAVTKLFFFIYVTFYFAKIIYLRDKDYIFTEKNIYLSICSGIVAKFNWDNIESIGPRKENSDRVDVKIRYNEKSLKHTEGIHDKTIIKEDEKNGNIISGTIEIEIYRWNKSKNTKYEKLQEMYGRCHKNLNKVILTKKMKKHYGVDVLDPKNILYYIIACVLFFKD